MLSETGLKICIAKIIIFSYKLATVIAIATVNVAILTKRRLYT